MSQQILSTADESYRANIHTIQSKVKKGRIQDLYNFEIKGQLNNIKNFVNDIFQRQNKPFKINLAFGYVLQSVAEEKYKFFHPSNNNSFLPQPKLIQTDKDKDDLIELCNPESITDFVYKSRFASSWVVHSIVCVTFRLTKL